MSLTTIRRPSNSCQFFIFEAWRKKHAPAEGVILGRGDGDCGVGDGGGGLASEGEGGEEQEERHEWLHGRGWVCLGTRLWYKEPWNIAKKWGFVNRWQGLCHRLVDQFEPISYTSDRTLGSILKSQCVEIRTPAA